MLDLDALLALEAKATKGPWRDQGEIVAGEAATTVFGADGDYCYSDDCTGCTSYLECRSEDRDFVIAARNALRPLVEELKAERARAKDLYVTLEQIAFGSYTLSGDCADDAKVTLARYDAARAASEKETG